MKLQWIVKAEETMPGISHGVIGKALHFVDGARDWHPATTAPFNRDLAGTTRCRFRAAIRPTAG